MQREGLLGAATRLTGAMISVIPIKSDGSKAPALDEWKSFQKNIATGAQLAEWFGNGKRWGIAAVCGEVSGNLEILDVDDAKLVEPLLDMVRAQGHADLVDKLVRVRTPSGGIHLAYRCSEIEPNQKLAARLIPDTEKPGKFKIETLIETRGRSGYFLLPGSPLNCHRDRRPYELIHGDLASLATITPNERAILFDAARSFNEFTKPKRDDSTDGIKRSSEDSGVRPGDDFNQRASWREILEAEGWKHSHSRGDEDLWRRPDKKGPGVSATTNYQGCDLLYVFSSNAYPFEPDTAYSKFAAYTFLNHAGDFHAATKALAQKGFGKRSTKPEPVPFPDDASASREPGDDTASEPWTGKESKEAEVKLPEAYPWIDITVSADDKSVVVGPGRYLTRGSGCLIVASTGSGKSTLCSTLAFTWGLGRSCLGFQPVQSLKSLVVQAEDDRGDLRDMASGILSVIRPTQEEREILRKSVLVVTERSRTGVNFLHSFVRPLLKEFSPDILWLNPLSAYFGADLNDQEAVAKFFRNTLNPILAEANCLAIIPHHIAKPSKERKDWTGGELAYLGSGSADLANWAREIIALRATAPGLFEMVATKRWRKLGWRDADGKPTNTRMIAHGVNGQMFWRDADAETLSEQGAQQYSDAALLALVPDEGIDKKVLISDVESTFAVCTRTATQYVNDACRARRRMVNGQQVRVALLATTERPRREVYPTEAKNRPVVWVKKVGLCK